MKHWKARPDAEVKVFIRGDEIQIEAETWREAWKQAHDAMWERVQIEYPDVDSAKTSIEVNLEEVFDEGLGG